MPSFCVVDVGHGNSCVLKDQDRVVVIDTGPRSRLLWYLRKNDIRRVDTLFISHADADHIGGAIELVQATDIDIGSVYINPDSSKKSETWNNFIYAVNDASKIKRIRLIVNLTSTEPGRISLGEVDIEVLAPDPGLILFATRNHGATRNRDAEGRPIDTNTLSAVLRLSYAGRQFILIPGDLDWVGLQNMLESGCDPTAESLVYPHHGGSSGAPDEEHFITSICGSVLPHIVVFSIRDNQKSFPGENVIKIIDKTISGCCMYATGNSETLASFIMASEHKRHKNDVGHIMYVLDDGDYKIDFERG